MTASKSYPIPFCDLSRAHGLIRDAIDEALSRVVDSGWFLRGHEVAAFEAEWAAYCGQAFCVACNSGTDALSLAAMASGRVVAEVQANTLPLTAIGLTRGMSKVVLRDVGADGRLETVTPQSVPVLLYGRVPSAGESEAHLFDAAHAHGWRPPPYATACWSFYPTKTLGALGDAGAVTTNDPDIAKKMRELSGLDDKFYRSTQITSRMDEVQAAVLRVKLRHLNAWISERRRIAAKYFDNLPPNVTPVSEREDFQHLFVVRCDDRDALASHLSRARIGTKVHFPVPLDRSEASWSDPNSKFPQADRWCASVLSLPCYPGLTEPEIDRICFEIERFHQRGGAKHAKAG